MTAAFLASLVEAVEALTIVLAVATAGVRERLLQWVSFSTELGRPRHVRFPPTATELRTSLVVRFVPSSDLGATRLEMLKRVIVGQ
jgi:hypothetical protein